MSADASVSTTNLDLSKVADENFDELVAKINSFYKQDSSIKTPLAWHWERNQLMLDGKQWLSYDASTGGGWSRLRVSSNNEYIPRPVTNYIYDSYQVLKSYMIKNRPRSAVTPNDTESYRDKTAAKIADLILEVNWVRLKEDLNNEVASANLVLYGTVFKKSYWDTSSMNLVKVPRTQMVPVTDPNTGMVIGQSEQPVLDPATLDPVMDELPLGDVNTSIVEPLRMSLDPLAMNLHEAKWVMESSVQTLDWVQETYSREEPGYTGKASEVKEEKELNGSLRRWFKLRTSSGTKDSILSAGAANSSDTMVENSCIVKEYYERPSSKHPKGRLVVIAGEQCVYSGDSPYEGPEMGDWHPYSECRWEIVPGRFWGKGPLDDAIELQKRLNAIDSTIVLTRKTMAVPQWTIPTGCGITPGSMTGRPGQEHFYRADGTGAKPEQVRPVGVDASVFTERAQVVADLKEITGAIDILRGDKPPGVDAASALSLLYEVGTGKLYPILDRWKLFVEQDQKKQLRLTSKNYKEPRPEFIKALKAKNTDLSDADINGFIGTDLYDNCNVIVEAGSNIPKLQSAKQSILLELAQLGLLNLQNPENRSKFQHDMGVSGYDSDVEPDKKRAIYENDLLDNIQNPPGTQPVVLAIDNHALHLEEHSNRMKSPKFMAMPFPVQQAYMAHIQQHENFQAQAMQAQMLQQQSMAPAPGSTAQAKPAAGPAHDGMGGAQHQAPAPGKSSRGPTADLKNAVFGSDILNPATLGRH